MAIGLVYCRSWSIQAINIVVLPAELNDVLKRDEGKLDQEIATVLKELRAEAQNVLIGVCTGAGGKKADLGH